MMDLPRLSPSGFKAFLKIMNKWGVGNEEAQALLGGMPADLFSTLKSDFADHLLDWDTLRRISLLIGIYKALKILYSPKLAGVWINLPNTNPVFAGATPLEYMLRNGIAGMTYVRQMLDARLG